MKHLTTVLSKINRPLPAWLTLVLILGGVAGATAPVFNGLVAIPNGATMNLPGSGTVVQEVPCTGLGWIQGGSQNLCMDQYGNVGVNTSLQVSEGLNTNTSVQSASGWHGIWTGAYDSTFPPPHNNLISQVDDHGGGTTNGVGDIAIGPCALCGGDTETTGLNIGMGGGALENGITTGYKNIGIGNWALRYVSSGYQNVAIGVTAGQGTASLITGHDNSFFGYASGADISAGSANTFLGSTAGEFVTAVNNDSAVGSGALANDTGGTNTAVGASAGQTNAAGVGGVFLGYDAGLNNTSGNYSVFVGNQAGAQNQTGSYNVLLGYQAGYGITSTSGNVIIGPAAGKATTGSQNTLMGFQSGNGITTGSQNVLLGPSNGATSYNQVTTGSQNVSIGYEAAVPSQTANGQLDIQNALYGTGNTGTDTTVSTGCLAFFATSCTNSSRVYVNAPLQVSNADNKGQASCALSASTSCFSSTTILAGSTCIASYDHATAIAQTALLPLEVSVSGTSLNIYAAASSSQTGTIYIDYSCW